MANVGSCSGSPIGAANPGCPAVMSSYCSTPAPPTHPDPDGASDYELKWLGDPTNSMCLAYVAYNANAGNLNQYQPVVDAFVREYLITDANPITYAQQGSLVFKPFINTVIDVCHTYPGGCDTVLKQVCGGYTRADLASNPSLAALCGCFMSANEYDTYTGAFGVQPICDPACVLTSAVKPINPSDHHLFLNCTQSVCVIDHVTIDILNNSSTGAINFSQACSSCGQGAGCICDISDISITAVQSTLGNISLSQACGGNVSCFKSNSNGVPQTVPCSSLEPAGSGTSSTASALSTSGLIFIIGGIIVLVIIIIIIALLVRRNKVNSIPTRNYQQPLASPPPAIGGAYGYNSYGGGLSQAPLIAEY